LEECFIDRPDFRQGLPGAGGSRLAAGITFAVFWGSGEFAAFLGLPD
jgi:hypothetical protein